ncbi:MAG: hypothetical protein ACYDEJ_05130 [Desulfitobacteriaceae bacterium]
MPDFFEKMYKFNNKKCKQWIAETAGNIYSYWASSNHYQSYISSLQLFMVASLVISLIKDEFGGKRKYWFLGYAVILMLSDIKLTWLKREIALVENSVDYLDIELTNAIKAQGIRIMEAFSKLSELEQAIQLLKEEIYGPDQVKDKDELGENNQDDYYNDDDFLGNDDEEQDDEG